MPWCQVRDDQIVVPTIIIMLAYETPICSPATIPTSPQTVKRITSLSHKNTLMFISDQGSQLFACYSIVSTSTTSGHILHMSHPINVVTASSSDLSDSDHLNRTVYPSTDESVYQPTLTSSTEVSFVSSSHIAHSWMKWHISHSHPYIFIM